MTQNKKIDGVSPSELSELLAVLYALQEKKEYEENYYREQMENEHRLVTITREMALDAGDPSMEGQQWYW